MTIARHVLDLKDRIRDCENRFHRLPGSVSLLAVSKGQSIEKILQAVAAGQRAFGESYLQEALPKMTLLEKEALEWHFIGPIQRNKTKKIAEHFAWVHSVDSILIAKRLHDQRPDTLPPLNICLQINISHEQTKSGAHRDEILNLAKYCRTLPRLALRGLMTIPKMMDNITDQRNEFRKLTDLYMELQKQGFLLDMLSMGMSHDWEAAIAEGATIIRIGSLIFGSRI